MKYMMVMCLDLCKTSPITISCKITCSLPGTLSRNKENCSPSLFYTVFNIYSTFQAVNLVGGKEAVRLDLTSNNSRIEKTKVGPLGSNLFDSAISVTSGPE